MEGDGVIGGGGECTPEVTELGDMGSAGFEWSFCGKGGKGGGPSPRAPQESIVRLWKIGNFTSGNLKTGIIQTIGCAGGNTVDSILQEP